MDENILIDGIGVGVLLSSSYISQSVSQLLTTMKEWYLPTHLLQITLNSIHI
jgi:hypothetical protein